MSDPTIFDPAMPFMERRLRYLISQMGPHLLEALAGYEEEYKVFKGYTRGFELEREIADCKALLGEAVSWGIDVGMLPEMEEKDTTGNPSKKGTE